MTTTTDASGIRRISMKEAWELPWVSWKLAKKYYNHALGFSFIFIGVGFLSLIPFLGKAIHHFLLTYLICSILKICRQWEAGEQPPFSQILNVFDDKPFFQKVLPFAIFCVIFSLAVESINDVSAKFLGNSSFITLSLMVVLSLVQSSFTSFGAGIVTFEKDMGLQQILSKNFQIYMKNIWPLGFSGLILIILMVFSFLFFLLPFFLFFMPMTIPCYYFIYRATCEGFILDSEKNFE